MADRGFAPSRVALGRLQGMGLAQGLVAPASRPPLWAAVDCTCLRLRLQIVDLSSVCRQGTLATATKIKVGESKAFC